MLKVEFHSGSLENIFGITNFRIKLEYQRYLPVKQLRVSAVEKICRSVISRAQISHAEVSWSQIDANEHPVSIKTIYQEDSIVKSFNDVGYDIFPSIFFILVTPQWAQRYQ